MLEQEIPDRNIFMMCERLNPSALSALPEGLSIRVCRPDELDIWKGFPFDRAEDKRAHHAYMSEYFDNVYAQKQEEFFRRCLFVCEEQTGLPVATGFLWKAYGQFYALHWIKTLKAYEGCGIGRALLSHILAPLDERDFPVYLHTQPSSFRAIGLYASFGFKILTDPMVGYRENHYQECLPILKKFMHKDAFESLQFQTAPGEFLEAARSSEISQF